MHHINVIKANGRIESFNPSKLMTSLMNAGTSEEDSKRILEEVLQEVEGQTLPTNKIYKKAFHHLNEVAHHASIRYSMRRALIELGPDGFAFEKFFAEILKRKGYETMVDQLIYGKCVPHELDVVAWKKSGELVMVESKFHNEFGFKTDLKVVLYVNARFQDLSFNEYSYGGMKMKMTSGWLVTNTKFTERAITYALCTNMNLVGWNYPKENNLQTMIEESGLRPITNLRTLSGSEIKEFIKAGIVTCNDTNSFDPILRYLGISTSRIEEIKKEAEKVCSYKLVEME
ncbi:MAG: ATP cone domain-containing protein [bacterium]|nr:ATP cone domain-containing protein [bacterium]